MEKQTNGERKKGKLSKLIILCVAVMLMLALCRRETTLEKVHAVFDSQEEVIRERIADTSIEDKKKWKDLEGVIKVKKESHGALRFICISEGIVSASLEAGFYYSPDNKPTCVGWLFGPLTEDGKGYSYSDGTDNYYYTEKMSENFYYYYVKN